MDYVAMVEWLAINTKILNNTVPAFYFWIPANLDHRERVDYVYIEKNKSLFPSLREIHPTMNQLGYMATLFLDYWNKERFNAPESIFFPSFPSTVLLTFYSVNSPAACASQ